VSEATPKSRGLDAPTGVAPVQRDAAPAPTPEPAARRRGPRALLCSDARVPAYALLLLSEALVLLAFWPGLITPDGNQTIYQAQTGLSLDWWTPFGAEALEWAFGWGVGVGTVYAIQVALVIGGLYACARRWMHRLPAGVLTLLIVLFPPMLSALSQLSRDTFYLGFSLLGLAALGAALERISTARGRWLLALAVGLSVLAWLCRQNGLVNVLVVVAAGGIVGLRGRVTVPRLIGRLAAAGAVSLAVLVATQIAYGALGVGSVHPERMLYLYDLASISTQSDHDEFPRELWPGHLDQGWITPKVDQRTLEARFDWANVISLFPDPEGPGKIDFASEEKAATEAPILRRAWRRAILDEPLPYAWGRLRLMTSQLGFTRRPTDAYYGLLSPTNFDQPLASYDRYKLTTEYLARFVGPNAPLSTDIGWTYLLVMLLATGYLWWRNRWGAAFPLALSAAVALNLAILLLVAMATSFRYMNLIVPVVALLVAYAAVDALGVRRTS
jgi:hypothetical protein